MTQEDIMHSNIPRLSLLKLVSIGSLGLTLLACGGGGGNRVDDVVNKPGSGNSSSISDIRLIGFGSGNNFKTGEIGVGIGSDTLSAGGTTSLIVNLVNADHSLSIDTATITLTSRCIAANEATLSVNPVPITNGQASVNYTANGCSGQDDITATANINGNILIAKASIYVETDTVGQIEFVEATPPQISLKGTGGNETSRVTFLVKGSTGAPLKGACVEFTLDIPLDEDQNPIPSGGLKLVDSKCSSSDEPGSTRSLTNAEGHAAISVQAGTIAMPVVIKAKHLETGDSSLSRSLHISTGIPDQKSMSLAASVFNPHGWEIQGTEVSLTVALADAFNNPAIDGTTVSFTTSGGVITDACQTINGTCSVIWKSQDPRPASGRVMVLAHTTGNESFMDVNGNGWYDDGVDIFAFDTTECQRNKNVPVSSAEHGGTACDDLGEAFLDHNFSGTYEYGKRFIDFNRNGIRDESNAKYNGVLCRQADHDIGLCSRTGVTIRKDIPIIMSSHHALLTSNGLLQGQPARITATIQTSNFSVLLADINNNPLPAKTKVSIDSSNAKNVDIGPSGEIEIPSTYSPQNLIISVTASSADTAPSGYLDIVITAPSGLITSTRTYLN
jgi:hypothetical protein